MNLIAQIPPPSAKKPKGISYDEVQGLYETTQLNVDESIKKIFSVTDIVTLEFSPIIVSAAAIYIALMGYALVSGYIVLNGKEAAIRFSKVVIIILLTRFFIHTGLVYEAVWKIPNAIGDFLTSTFNGDGGKTKFKSLMDDHSKSATYVGQKYAQDHKPGDHGLAIGTWAITMAPIFVINISIIIAKVISAVLFFIAPIIFILSLLGLQNNYLSAWFKAILLTFLTVIIVFVVGVFVLDIVDEQLVKLINLPYVAGEPLSIVKFAPLGVLSIFGVVIVSQATTIASSIIGAAAINTQQATGFLQIAALQGANKLGKPS